MDTEIELKFLVSDTVITHIPGLITQFGKRITNFPARNLLNAYFDTPNRELRALDIGLRTRCCDGECEQTIKLAGEVVGGLHQRPEYNVALSGNRPDLEAFPANIWPHGMQISAINQSLYPIFSTNFIRRTWLVETENGSEIEVVLDKGEVSASGQHLGICEVEMELKKGHRSDIFALAKQLIQCSEVRLGLYSKAARGYMLADHKPLKADNYINYVPLTNDMTQEQALIACLNYGIRFVQKHEQCYFEDAKFKTLKLMMDGIALIRHTFWLFEAIVDKQTTEHLRQELKWFLHTFSWVEGAIQIKTFTSKKHAYYKKISKAPSLNAVIEDIREQRPRIASIKAIFQSPRYNNLILALTTFLVDKSWRTAWSAQNVQAAELKVIDIAADLFEKDWQEMQTLLPLERALTAQDYLAQKNELQRNLLSGACLGSLFASTKRDEYRSPWFDIVEGIDELGTLDYLQRLSEQQSDDALANIQVWLAQKTENLVAAMEQSRQVTLKQTPYWR
ncbi:CYTH and CHAD domain-containing protein [Pseudoalteromonas tunicata]|uniref:CYTH and CHAD domain-containing protein n=1 Tax=Pseudoalteromonas tunicata TaxID=314281 RepID=UPI00273E9AB6|nr:CYTH and CHAD domain-containing protein [Pseudoalteromonas tunicata]MDP4984068.1 CYTH domain-containing protein [Pseudoalteromonas tunicata]MDP5214412.1 CYTH domain-containing protein [Pseudoalteromonas tunicata]